MEVERGEGAETPLRHPGVSTEYTLPLRISCCLTCGWVPLPGRHVASAGSGAVTLAKAEDSASGKGPREDGLPRCAGTRPTDDICQTRKHLDKNGFDDGDVHHKWTTPRKTSADHLS